ncbi:MAG: potassium transporter TrkG [Phycisphaerales bacterium]
MPRPIAKVVAVVIRFADQIGPIRLVLVGYAIYAVVGWVLLAMPFSHTPGTSVAAVDSLFTSVSALSTTGLSTVSMPDAFSWFGELVILLLIQMGGLGYMTLGSFIVLSTRRELGGLRTEVGKITFSMPEGFGLASFVRTVCIYTFALEFVGAAALYFAFRDAGVKDAAWPAVFHSVSAFCTAGFSTFPDSLETFRDDFWVNSIISFLSIAGAIGFIVVADMVRWLGGHAKSMTVTSRIILFGTIGGILGGTALILMSDPSIREMPPHLALQTAFFQSMTAATTVGFNSVPINEMSRAAIAVVTILMIIGSSPSGTGGGLKITTLSALLGQTVAALRGKDRVTFWGRRIPHDRVQAATSGATCYMVTLAVGVFLVLLVDKHVFEDVVFEVASALGTVGLSRGITPDLSPLAKIIITALMYVGRVGPLTIGVAMFLADGHGPCDEDLVV